MKTIGVAAALTLVAASASAQYKCVGKDGAVTFQQQPCAPAAQQQKLDVRAPAAPTPVAPREKSSAERQLDSMVADRQQRERAQEIASLETAIANRNILMEQELNYLRSKKGYAKNNLAGATWEQSISTEMQAVTQKYKAMNDVDMARLVQLRR